MTIAIVLLLILAAAATGLLWYSGAYHHRQALVHEELPPTAIGDLEEEGTAKVVGKVVALAKPVQSPLSRSKCVYYRLLIERQELRDQDDSEDARRRDSDKDGEWNFVVEEVDSIAFAIEDETGTAKVEAKHLESDISSRRRVKSGFLKSLSPAQEDLLNERFPTKKLSFTKKMRYSEVVIQEGDELMVTGDVELPKGDDPFFRSSSKDPVQLSDETINEAAMRCRSQAQAHTAFSGVAGACALGIAIWLIVHLLGGKKSSDVASTPTTPTASNPAPDDSGFNNVNPDPVNDNGPVAVNPKNRPNRDPGFDIPPPLKNPDDDLPKGNDLDAVMARFKVRVERNQGQWRDDLRQLALLFTPENPRRSDVYKFLIGYADNADVFVKSDARREAFKWAARKEVPDLCKLLTAERDGGAQREIIQRLKELNDPAAAATVAVFLKDNLRGEAEQALKNMGAAAERAVIPYAKDGYDRDTRASAIRVLEAIATAEGGKLVEQLTRDPDDHVNGAARSAFEAIAKRAGVERDTIALLAALDAAIRVKDGGKFDRYVRDLQASYRDDHPRRAEVFKFLMDNLKAVGADGFGKREFTAEAVKWSGKEDVAGLCELLVGSGGESAVFARLKDLKDPKSAKDVASFLPNFFKAGEAAAVLRDIGPQAQKAVHPYLLDPKLHFAQRCIAADLLGDIGTHESMKELQSVVFSRAAFVADRAAAAIKKIQERAKKK